MPALPPVEVIQMLEELDAGLYAANAVKLASIAAKIRSFHASAPCSRDCFDARCGLPSEETFRGVIRLLHTSAAAAEAQSDLNKRRLKNLFVRTFRCALRHSYTIELFTFDVFL